MSGSGYHNPSAPYYYHQQQNPYQQPQSQPQPHPQLSPQPTPPAAYPQPTGYAQPYVDYRGGEPEGFPAYYQQPPGQYYSPQVQPPPETYLHPGPPPVTQLYHHQQQQQIYPRPLSSSHQASLPTPVSAYSNYIPSPTPVALSPHISQSPGRDPSFNQSPSAFSDPSPQLPLPLLVPPPVTPAAGISPIKLVIKRPSSSHPPPPPPPPAASPQPTSSTVDPANLTMSRRSSNTVKVEEIYSNTGRPVRGARVAAQQNISQYLDSDDEDDHPANTRRSGRASKGKAPERYEDDFEDKMMTSPPVAIRQTRNNGRAKRIIDPDEDEDEEEEEDAFGEPDDGSPPRRKPFPPRTTKPPVLTVNGNGISADGATPIANSKSGSRTTRASARAKSRGSSADEEYHAPSNSGTATDAESEDIPHNDYDDNFENDDDDDFVSQTSSPARRRPTRNAKPSRVAPRRSTRNSARTAHDSEDEYGAPKRTLRERTSKVNYQLPPLDISAELVQDAIAGVSGPSRRRGVGFAGGTRLGTAAGTKGLPWSMRGSNLARAMGDPDTSDSDMDMLTPMKPASGSGTGGGQAAVGGGGPRVTNPSDVPNFGRINPKSNMADADPLGVDMNVTFDNVGGLDGHINQLKEMVALPLLYPELFQQFGITPPRGVLFHGPPGTGKTLLARALAASCSTGNTKIAFFMRKGADVLSKWVGEAERQLRMLFEEARAAQPSIIFFDEIDGLAPVRSSKQDQIHASLVSTLLALMDGMDGRGQVIVIGATNRPDAVDPALRRPGRFDREFYFPLPNREARKKIIGINTRKWTPGLSDEMLDQLALLTKGYGGADLRALCTEAALNAIQRRYPQIYSTTDRLLLNPESIHVGAKDFMMSVKKIVPSSARSTSSAAAQLPQHLAPLLSSPLERLKVAIEKVLPRHKNKTALEEAEWEDDIGDDLKKHMMVQSLDKMRTFKPRILVHGPGGMGQNYLGPAILHHFEGFHVQSLDLGSLMGDSISTTEASLVQKFVEAKRHQPSIIFIPSLLTFAHAIPESARTTFRALLDGVPSADPVLVLAILDGKVEELPGDVKRWFGIGREGRVQLLSPSSDERRSYFTTLIETFSRPPTAFPDALPRRKRVLEILPPAPPLPPRAPTEAELQREIDRDNNARNMMVISFTGLLEAFNKKYRKVVATVKEDALHLAQLLEEQAAAAKEFGVAPVPDAESLPNGQNAHEAIAVQDDFPQFSSSAPAVLSVPPLDLAAASGTSTPAVDAPNVSADAAPTQTETQTWVANDVDLDTLHRRLFKHKYHTPSDFLDDIAKIEENASRLGDPDRLSKIAEMAAHARLHVAEFDPKWTPEFERLKVRMLARKAERDAKKKEVAEAAVPAASAEPANVIGTPASGGSKRAREDGVEETDEQGREKRARETDMEVDGFVNPLASVDQGVLPSTVPIASTLGGDQLAVQTHNAPDTAVPQPAYPPIPDAPLGEATVPSAAIPPPQPQALSDPASLASVPPPQAAPSSVYPPFICPAEDLALLEEDLERQTVTFNIDQLEQLRAGVYDRLWRSRGDWDRRKVIGECREWVGEFVKEVEDWLEDEDGE